MQKPEPTDEKPGATGMADRVGIDTPGELRGHSMSAPAMPSSLLDRWRLMCNAASDVRLSRVDLAVLIVILNHINGTSGEAWPGAEALAKATGAVLRSIRYSRSRLVKFGYLIERRADGRPNRYRIGTPAMDCTPATSCTPAVDCMDPCNPLQPTPAVDCSPPLQPIAAEHAYRTSLKNQKKEPAKKHSPASRAEKQKDVHDSFDRFWSAYPRGAAKKDAEKAWRQVKGDQHVDAILADLATRTEWIGDKFTPLPASYLRGERWNDVQQPQTITDRIRKSAEDFGDYDFGKSLPGRVSVPNEQQADAMNAKAAARLAKSRPSVADSFEGKVYTGTPDDELPEHLRPAAEATP